MLIKYEFTYKGENTVNMLTSEIRKYVIVQYTIEALCLNMILWGQGDQSP